MLPALAALASALFLLYSWHPFGAAIPSTISQEALIPPFTSSVLLNVTAPELHGASTTIPRWSVRATDEAFLTSLEGCSRLPSPDAEGVVPKHYPRPRAYDRRECRCTPVTNFVILSMQRSGSGALVSFLNSHPNISTQGEILQLQETKGNVSKVLAILDQVYNLDFTREKSSVVLDTKYNAERVGEAKNECTAAAGLKWMLNQGVLDKSHRGIFLEYFKRNSVSVILLERKNALRRLMSLRSMRDKRLRGNMMAHILNKTEAEMLAKFKPKLFIKSLVRDLKRMQNPLDAARKAFSGARMKVVTYEELLQNQTTLFHDIQEFLGVPVMELHSPQVKIHTKPLNVSIGNFMDVAQTLKGTEFEMFLDGDRYL